MALAFLSLNPRWHSSFQRLSYLKTKNCFKNGGFQRTLSISWLWNTACSFAAAGVHSQVVENDATPHFPPVREAAHDPRLSLQSGVSVKNFQRHVFSFASRSCSGWCVVSWPFLATKQNLVLRCGESSSQDLDASASPKQLFRETKCVFFFLLQTCERNSLLETNGNTPKSIHRSDFFLFRIFQANVSLCDSFFCWNTTKHLTLQLHSRMMTVNSNKTGDCICINWQQLLNCSSHCCSMLGRNLARLTLQVSMLCTHTHLLLSSRVGLDAHWKVIFFLHFHSNDRSLSSPSVSLSLSKPQATSVCIGRVCVL